MFTAWTEPGCTMVMVIEPTPCTGRGGKGLFSATLGLISILLAGCQTTEDRLAADDATCKSYGVAPGSPGYIQCRTNLDQNRANVKASERFGQFGRLGRGYRASFGPLTAR